MSSPTALTHLFTTTTALLAAGSLIDTSTVMIPQLQALPASHSLPLLRWYFSRGSHVFPPAAMLSAAGYIYLAYTALPDAKRGVVQLLLGTLTGENSVKVLANLVAAVCTIGVAPFTALVMIPTNFALIARNERLGGSSSEFSAKHGGAVPANRSAEESVDSKGEGEGFNQFTDLSGPQGRTTRESSQEEDREVRELLGKFGRMNLVRAGLFGVGGVLGLWAGGL